MANWVTVKNIVHNNEMSRCQHSYTADYNCVKKLDRQDISNLTLGSWDIEAFSHTTRYENKNDFPDPTKEKDIITQIGTSVYKLVPKKVSSTL